LALITIALEVENQLRPEREYHGADSSLSVIGVELLDNSSDKIEASAEVSFAIGFNAS